MLHMVCVAFIICSFASVLLISSLFPSCPRGTSTRMPASHITKCAGPLFSVDQSAQQLTAPSMVVM